MTKSQAFVSRALNPFVSVVFNNKIFILGDTSNDEVEYDPQTQIWNRPKRLQGFPRGGTGRHGCIGWPITFAFPMQLQ
jgi:hypothetical protein